MNDLFGHIMIDIEKSYLSNDDISVIANKHVGGIIFFAKNFDSFEQISNLIIEIKKIKKNLLFAVDQEGGRVQRFTNNFTKLPSLNNLAKYSKNFSDPNICKETAWLTSLELLAAGIDINFAPVLDVDENTSSIIADRSFSGLPDEVIKYASEYIDGMHEAGMKSVAKHFPGHGGIKEDSHISLAEDKRTINQLNAKDLKPYIQLNNKIDAILCGHVLFSNIDKNIPIFSKFWLKEYLKEYINFNGIIFTDDLTMAGSGNDECKIKARKAIETGCDMVLICNSRDEVTKTIEYFDQIDIKPSNKILKMKKNINVSWDKINKTKRVNYVRNKLQKYMNKQ